MIYRKDIITLPKDFPFAFYDSDVRAGPVTPQLDSEIQNNRK